MKRPTIPFLAACLLAAGAGVAIAGVPSSSNGGSLALTPGPTTTTTTTTTTTVPAAPPTAATPPDTTEPATTEPTTTAPPSSAPRATATSRSPTAAPPTTTSPTTTPPQALDRDQLVIATVNASDRGGVAGQYAEQLEEVGYVDVAAVDALDPRAVSGVFYAPGLELEALRAREDLGWIPGDVLSQDLMPELETDRTFDLVVVIGRDRASPPPTTTTTEP